MLCVYVLASFASLILCCFDTQQTLMCAIRSVLHLIEDCLVKVTVVVVATYEFK